MENGCIWSSDSASFPISSSEFNALFVVVRLPYTTNPFSAATVTGRFEFVLCYNGVLKSRSLF